MLVNNKRIPILHLIFIGFLPSFIKKWIYILKGYKIGKKTRIGFGSVIVGNAVTIGDGVRIDYFSLIICTTCHVERNVSIGSFVYLKVDKISIGFQTVIRENNLFGGMDIGKSELAIGHMSHIHQKCLINTTLPVRIGNFTAIGGGSYLFTHSSWQSVLEGYPCTFEPIEIGNNVWISWNVFILPGVKIGDSVLVSASSVVSKNLPSSCLAAGNPAKPVIPEGFFPREPHPQERDEILLKILYEYMSFLEKNGFMVKSYKQDNITIFEYDKSRNKNEIFYFGSGVKVADNSVFPSNCIVVSLDEISEKNAKTLYSKNISFIDVHQKLAIGRGSHLLELTRYLKHYGIHLIIKIN